MALVSECASRNSLQSGGTGAYIGTSVCLLHRETNTALCRGESVERLLARDAQVNTEISKEEMWVWTPGGTSPEYTRTLPEHLFLKLQRAVEEFDSIQDEINEYLEK
jgi:hypothetical protein